MKQIMQYSPVYIDFILPEVILLIGAFIFIFYGLFSKSSAVKVINISLILLYLVCIYKLFKHTESVTIFSSSLLLNKFTQFSKIIVLLMNIIFLLSYKTKKFEMPVIITLSTIGIFILLSSNTLLSLYLGLELLSIGIYTLICSEKNLSLSSEAALKYLMLGAISSGIFLFGSSMIYGYTGSINFEEIALIYKSTYCANFCTHSKNLVLITGFIFVLVSIFFKLAVVPFHNWTPDVYEGSGTRVTMFLASSVKYGTIMIFMRLIIELLYPIREQIQIILSIVGIASLLLGSIAAIIQTRYRRLMAYSTINHMGFITLSILPCVALYNKNTIFYFLTYSISLISFFVIMLVLERSKVLKGEISDLSGLFNKNKFLCISITIMLFSMSGVPPFTGFFAKLYVFMSLIKNHNYIVSFVAALSTLIALFYYINVIKIMFFEKGNRGIAKVKIKKFEYVIILFGIVYNTVCVLNPSKIINFIENSIY